VEWSGAGTTVVPEVVPRTQSLGRDGAEEVLLLMKVTTRGVGGERCGVL
jgi:hypothetical protein